MAAGWGGTPDRAAVARRCRHGGVGALVRRPPACGRRGDDPVHDHARGRFPDAQFLVVGVPGPGSNAHGPNEFLHVPTGVRLTASVAEVPEPTPGRASG